MREAKTMSDMAEICRLNERLKELNEMVRERDRIIQQLRELLQPGSAK